MKYGVFETYWSAQRLPVLNCSVLYHGNSWENPGILYENYEFILALNPVSENEDSPAENEQSDSNVLKTKNPGVSDITAKISTVSVKSLQKLQQAERMDTSSKDKGSRLCSVMWFIVNQANCWSKHLYV